MRGKREYNHRTLLLSVILLLLNIANVTSQNYTKTFKIDFSENDFLLEESEGMYRITPNEILYDWEYNYSEPSGLSKPCIPYVKLHILIPDNYRIKEVSFNVDSVIYAEGVRLEPVPPIGQISTGANEMQSLYPSQYYPIEINFVDGIESIFDGYRIADFEISLFAYNAFSGLLSMASSIYLTLNVEPTINDSFIHTGDMDSFLKRFVYNPEDFGKGLEGWTPVSVNIIETDSGNPSMRIAISNSTFHCTAPNAAKLEVYTMDAVKVGEARFVNGEATVKVGSTPALYLYVVTYPDGHRESGKVLVNEE